MAVGLIVGGWFASAFLGKLADKIRSYIGEQYDYQNLNIKDLLKRLEENLNKIQAAMHAADQSKIENPGLKNWLSDLKNVSYDAEDLLDKYEYQLLKDEVKGKNKVSVLSKSHTFAKRLVGDSYLNELLAIVEKFDKLVDGIGCLLQFVSLERSSSPKECKTMRWRLTTSASSEPQLFGRDNQRAHLIELLLEGGYNEDVSSSKSIHVLPILGIGGVGKTTIAQWAYNDQSVKDHFDIRAWVCVTNEFEVKRLMKELIESSFIRRPDDFHDLQNLDSIQEILKRGLTGKKFLIVLDDVWNEVISKWESLLSALNSGKKGSKVIVTTRIQPVARMMGTMETIVLKGLADLDFWNFFVQCAFGDVNCKDHPKLEFIARKIAKRLCGLPLAAKTVGSALKFNFEEKHWSKILESKVLQAGQPEDGIVPVLRLSYEYLPVHLKQCFVYCSMFPKSYHFRKVALIQIWMAHGFIQSNEVNSMEDIGQSYVDELINRSFFEGNTSDSRFVIHDLLHDLALHISGDECLRLEENVSDNEQPEIPHRVRHLRVHADSLTVVCGTEHIKKNLRSLVIHGPANSEVSLDSLKEVEHLRVLILDNLRLKWSSNSISKMIHLRYLCLDKVSYDKFPESLCKLYHLQVLDLEYFDKLPKKVNNLISLRFLNANPDEISKIDGIGKLTSLQQLVKFRVRKESGYSIRQLQNMKQLRRLCIENLENVGSKKEASEAMLDNKRHLHTLSLGWGTRNHINSHEVLEGLQPHQNLKKLTIQGYHGTHSPGWMDRKWLFNLEYIRLFNCSSLEVLPPLGQLPFLKVLELFDMKAVERIGPEFYGDCDSRVAFPSLERLVFDRMFKWKEWFGVKDGYQLFPRLSYLGIRDCLELGGPLHLPSTLKKLDVRQSNKGLRESPESFSISLNTDISILEKWIPLQGLSNLISIYISNDEVTSFSTELEEWFQHLTSLQTLEFEDCSNLRSLPSQLSKLSSLEVLSIKGCCAVQSLPEEGLPTSLKELIIQNCDPELMERCREGGPDRHKIDHIPIIRSEYYSIGEEVVAYPRALICRRTLPLTFWKMNIAHLTFTMLPMGGAVPAALLLVMVIFLGMCYKFL